VTIIRSSQLVQKTVNATGDTVLATVPSGHRWAIKDWRFTSWATSPGIVTAYCTSAGGADVQFLDIENPAVRFKVYSGLAYVVLDPGDKIGCFLSSVSGGASFFGVSGMDFLL